MNLGIDKIVEKLENNDLVGSFIKQLEESLENKKELSKEKLENEQIKTRNEENKTNQSLEEDLESFELTQEEEIKLERKEFEFLQEYFAQELSDSSKAPIYIVTNKYENDNEYHRYKVTQYKNNFECKYIAFEKDLPENVKLGDAVRKVDGSYIYDEEATVYLKQERRRMKEEIINSRKNHFDQ